MNVALVKGLLLAGHHRRWFLSGAAAAIQPTQQTTTHAPDGGVREMLQSIDIPTLTNAAFTANVETEWTKILPDGTTATQKNHRTVARDTSGRVFQERRYFAPNGDKAADAVIPTGVHGPEPARALHLHPAAEDLLCQRVEGDGADRDACGNDWPEGVRMRHSTDGSHEG